LIQTKAAYNGQSLVNEAAPLVHEYNTRVRLAKLGYRSDLGSLSAFKAECFTLIDRTLDAERAKEAKSGKR